MNESLEVAIFLSTLSTNGLVFLLANDEGEFVTLGLVEGQIVVQYDFGLNSTHHLVNASISDGQWHTLVLRYSETDLQLMVDEMQYSFPFNDFQDIPVTVFDAYIGSLVESIPLFLELIQPNGFEGSVIEFQVNGIEISLIDAEVNIGRNVGQSPMVHCSYIMCMNGGVCSGIDNDPWFKCECPFGYSGEFCQVSLPFCSPNPCNGGECKEFEDRTFICSCPLGYQGRFCDQGN